MNSTSAEKAGATSLFVPHSSLATPIQSFISCPARNIKIIFQMKLKLFHYMPWMCLGGKEV
jgi:hypothetical protein